MTKVVAEISMSLDGFVTGSDPGLDNGLGTGGEPLHRWAIESDHEVDVEMLRAAVEPTGAVVMGRRLFDIVDGPQGWNDEMGYGGSYAASPSFFVVTHSPPAHVRLDLDLTFVTDGIAAAIDRARDAAGDEDVCVMGGADVVRQCVDEGLADELRIHVAPILLGAGTRLFEGAARRELEQLSVRWSPMATHITYGI